MPFNESLDWKAVFREKIVSPGLQWLDTPVEKIPKDSRNIGFSPCGRFVFRTIGYSNLAVADAETWKVLWEFHATLFDYACGREVCAVNNWVQETTEFRILSSGQLLPCIRASSLKTRGRIQWSFCNDYALSYQRLARLQGLFCFYIFERDIATRQLVQAREFCVDVHDLPQSIHGKMGCINSFGVLPSLFWCLHVRRCSMNDTQFRYIPQLMVFSNESRKLLWAVTLPLSSNAVQAWIVTSKNHLICAMDCKHMSVYRLQDGQQTCELPLPSQSTPLWLSDGRLLVQSNSRNVRLCTLDDSTGVMSVSETVRVRGQCSIIPLGARCFLAVADNAVRCYDLDLNNKCVWTHRQPGRSVCDFSRRHVAMDCHYRWLSDRDCILSLKNGEKFDPDNVLDAMVP